MSLIPSHNRLFNTVSLRGALVDAARAIAGLGRDAQARRYICLSRLCARIVRALIACETLNAQREVKRKMQADYAWRLRVLTDFGGEAGLKRWEAREAKSQQAKKGDAAQARLANLRASIGTRHERYAGELNRHANRHALVFRDRVTLDQEGQFRMAPIARMARGAPRVRAAIKPLARGMPIWHAANGLPPIILTPKDLRYRQRKSEPDFNRADGLRSGPQTRPDAGGHDGLAARARGSP